VDAWLQQSIALQLLTGVGLAAAAGLRAFLPPLVVGVLARLGVVPLHPGFDWLASTPALIIFGTAVAVELLGDKVPAVDHALDTVGTVLKPASGTVLLASSLTDVSPMTAAVLGILFGGTVAVAVHVTKAGLRVASTAVTGGAGSPAVSAVEDGVSLAGTFVAVLYPLLLIPLAIGLILLARAGLRRWRARRSPAAGPVT
jgi:hypothetical protein